MDQIYSPEQFSPQQSPNQNLLSLYKKKFKRQTIDEASIEIDYICQQAINPDINQENQQWVKSSPSTKTENQFMKSIRAIKNKMMVREITSKLRTRMFKNLNNFQLHLLNEPQINDQEQAFKSLLKINQKKLSQISNQNNNSKINQIYCSFYKLQAIASNISQNIPIFQPDSILKLTWDLLILINSFIIIFVVTLYLSFGTDEEFIISKQTLFYLMMIQVLDIFINFNTGFYLKGELIENHWEILKIYTKKRFITDFLSILPTLIYIYILNWSFNDNLRIILITIIFKIEKFATIIKKYKEIWNLNNKQENILNLVKLSFTILVISHFIACIWVVYGFNNTDQETWLQRFNLMQSSRFEQYIHAYYFSTVGHGDILPVNSYEMILCVFTIFIFCGVFGYTMNTIGQIIKEFFQKDTEIYKNLTIINQFMEKHNVSQHLRYQIREYLEYYWKETADYNEEMELKIINQLSNSLKEKLLLESNKLMLKECFASNFSEQVISNAVPLIKEIKCSPEQIVFSQGDIDDCSIYIVQKGKVELLMRNHLKPNQQNKNTNFFKIKEQKAGDHFGTLSFFTKTKRGFTAKCTEFTTFLVLNRQDFLQMLKQFPQDYEKFREINDKITFQNRYDLIDYECRSCNSYKHTISSCPMIHFVHEKYKTMLQFNHGKQLRQIYDKKRRDKICTLNELGDIIESAKDFQDDYKEMIEEQYQQIIKQDEDYQLLQVACKNQIMKQYNHVQYNECLQSFKDVVQESDISPTQKLKRQQSQVEYDDVPHSSHTPQQDKQQYQIKISNFDNPIEISEEDQSSASFDTIPIEVEENNQYRYKFFKLHNNYNFNNKNQKFQDKIENNIKSYVDDNQNNEQKDCKIPDFMQLKNQNNEKQDCQIIPNFQQQQNRINQRHMLHHHHHEISDRNLLLQVKEIQNSSQRLKSILIQKCEFDDEVDQMKIFINYMIYNNYDQILKKFQTYRQEKEQKQQNKNNKMTPNKNSNNRNSFLFAAKKSKTAKFIQVMISSDDNVLSNRQLIADVN